MRLIRCVLLATFGEAVGFGIPAAVGVSVTAASWGPSATLFAMGLAGSVEGAVLGAAQADCLFRWGSLAGTATVGGGHKRRRRGRMIARDAAKHAGRSALDCGHRRCGWNGCDDLADLCAARAILRAS